MNNNKVGTSKKIKVFKTATKVSIMDVNSALDYYKEKQDEITYRGNLAFVINEYGRSKVQLQAFLPKSTCKMVFNSIINGSFSSLFPKGYEKFGGSPKTKRARTLRISFEQNNQDYSKSRFIFQIDEGQGSIGANGQIKMTKREKSVRTYVSIELGIELAHEIIDYIRHEELIGLMNDKPLYSWSTFQPKSIQTNGNQNNFQQGVQQPFNQVDNRQNYQGVRPNNYQDAPPFMNNVNYG